MDETVLRTDALTLARQIRTKQVSAVAVVDAVLQRIEALQPTVNAFHYRLDRFTLRWAASP